MKRYCHLTATKVCDSPTVQHASSLSSHHDFDDALLSRNSHATMQTTKMQPIYHVIFMWHLTGTVAFLNLCELRIKIHCFQIKIRSSIRPKQFKTKQTQ